MTATTITPEELVDLLAQLAELRADIEDLTAIVRAQHAEVTS